MNPNLLKIERVDAYSELKPTDLVLTQNEENEMTSVGLVLGIQHAAIDSLQENTHTLKITHIECLLLTTWAKFEFVADEKNNLVSLGLIQDLDFQQNEEDRNIKNFYGYTIHHKLNEDFMLPKLHHATDTLLNIPVADLIEQYELKKIPVAEVLDAYDAKIFLSKQKPLRMY